MSQRRLFHTEDTEEGTEGAEKNQRRTREDCFTQREPQRAQRRAREGFRNVSHRVQGERITDEIFAAP